MSSRFLVQINFAKKRIWTTDYSGLLAKKYRAVPPAGVVAMVILKVGWLQSSAYQQVKQSTVLPGHFANLQREIALQHTNPLQMPYTIGYLRVIQSIFCEVLHQFWKRILESLLVAVAEGVG